MAMPEFTMRQLLEAGVHFGHRTRRWNPKMAPYMYGARNDIHIIDLTRRSRMLHRALRRTARCGSRRGTRAVRRHQACRRRIRSRPPPSAARNIM